MSSAIVYKKQFAFDPEKLQGVIQSRLRIEKTMDIDAIRGNFRTMQFAANGGYSFQLGYGSHEAAHADLKGYQAILVVNPNNWVLKSPRDRQGAVYQDAGDLVVLKTSVLHEVVQEKDRPKVTDPWLYIFIDAWDRPKWDVPKHKAEEMALEAVSALNDPIFLNWFTANSQPKRKR